MPFEHRLLIRDEEFQELSRRYGEIEQRIAHVKTSKERIALRTEMVELQRTVDSYCFYRGEREYINRGIHLLFESIDK